MRRKIIPGRNCSGFYFQSDKIGRQDAFENSEIETARRWVIWAIHREREAECWAIHEKAGTRKLGHSTCVQLIRFIIETEKILRRKSDPAKVGEPTRKRDACPNSEFFGTFDLDRARKNIGHEILINAFIGEYGKLRECRGRRSHIFDCKRSTKSEKPFFSPVLCYSVCMYDRKHESLSAKK